MISNLKPLVDPGGLIAALRWSKGPRCAMPRGGTRARKAPYLGLAARVFANSEWVDARGPVFRRGGRDGFVQPELFVPMDSWQHGSSSSSGSSNIPAARTCHRSHAWPLRYIYSQLYMIHIYACLINSTHCTYSYVKKNINRNRNRRYLWIQIHYLCVKIQNIIVNSNNILCLVCI